LSRLKENLGLKLTYAFIGVIIVVLTAFTSLAVVHEAQRKSRPDRTGDLARGVLSHTSVMGVCGKRKITDGSDGRDHEQ
jgi:hypothetical protein